MNNKVSKGIALLLFGILLCAGSEEINAMILSGFGVFSVFCDRRHCRGCRAVYGVL